ncbi:hypothetical protein TYRP_003985 [Tyrophagus putrescentiae]|nr:hypothetical protein TYRP_003985 [Tyrophagus putrescentiae]
MALSVRLSSASSSSSSSTTDQENSSTNGSNSNNGFSRHQPKSGGGGGGGTICIPKWFESSSGGGGGGGHHRAAAFSDGVCHCHLVLCHGCAQWKQFRGAGQHNVAVSDDISFVVIAVAAWFYFEISSRVSGLAHRSDFSSASIPSPPKSFSQGEGNAGFDAFTVSTVGVALTVELVGVGGIDIDGSSASSSPSSPSATIASITQLKM